MFNNFFNPHADSDTEVQRNFRPEDMRAVFDKGNGDVSKLRKSLATIAATVESSSTEIQRSILRELQLSGVFGFACTIIMVYENKNPVYDFACEVFRLVHKIEENENIDALEKLGTLQKRQSAPQAHHHHRHVEQNKIVNEKKKKNRSKVNDDDEDSSSSDEEITNNTTSSNDINSSMRDSSSPSSSLVTTPTFDSTPMITSAVVPLLRATDTRLPPERNPSDPSYNRHNKSAEEDDDDNSAKKQTLGSFISSFASTASNNYNFSSHQLVRKYCSIITIAAIIGVTPDHNADEVYSPHSTLAIRILARLVTDILSSEDAALCCPLAASLVLKSSRQQIERLLAHKYNDSNISISTGSSVMAPATQLAMWRDSTMFCLKIFKRAGTNIRPRDLPAVMGAIRHALRHFYAVDEDRSSDHQQNIFTGGNAKNFQNTTVAEAIANRTSAASSVDLRRSLGQLVHEAASVVSAAVTRKWLSTASIAFFHCVCDAALVSLRDPEISATGAFGACLYCLPRVGTVVLRGANVDIQQDIIRPIMKLWDQIDERLPSLIKTANHETITSLANGLQGWVAEFNSLLSPHHQMMSADLKRDLEHHRKVWGTPARKELIENRTVNTILMLFDLTLLVQIPGASTSSLTNKNNNNNNDIERSDETLSLWFPQLWCNNVIFVLLRHSTTFVKFLMKARVRKAILRFAQTIATKTTTHLLEFWHVLDMNVDVMENNDDDDYDSDSDSDVEFRSMKKKKTTTPILSISKRNRMLDLDGIRRLDVPLQQLQYPDLLARLLNVCRCVRRDECPPGFVYRTLKLLCKAPCEKCEYGILFKGTRRNRQQQRHLRPKPCSYSLSSKYCRHRAFYGGTEYTINHFMHNFGEVAGEEKKPNSGDDTNNDDDDDENAIPNHQSYSDSNLQASSIDDTASVVSWRDDESIASARTANLATINNQIDRNMSLQQRAPIGNDLDDDDDDDASQFHVLGEEEDDADHDDKGQGEGKNNNTSNKANIRSAKQNDLLHIANLVLNYQFSSVKTLRPIIELLDEVVLRCYRESSGPYVDHWQAIVNVCFEILSRWELQGLPRQLEKPIFKKQWLAIETTVRNKIEQKIATTPDLLLNGNTDEENDDIIRKILDRELTEAELELQDRFSAPLDRLTPQDLFTLSKIFQRGKGWFNDSFHVAKIRQLFDRKRIEYLYSRRDDIWARCLLHGNSQIAFVVSEVATTDNGGRSRNGANDDGDHERTETKTTTIVVSTRLLFWTIQRRLQQQKQQQDSTRRSVGMMKASQDVSYHVMKYLVDVGEVPENFDALAKLINV